MDPNRVSRRALLVAGAGLAASKIALPDTAPLTASQAIDRIKKNVGIPWRAQTVDNIIAGEPNTPVTGIATTMMATLDVIERAAAAAKNLVITHEPTFYMHQDKTEAIAQDATYLFKLDFIRRHNLVVFHFHDHWHARKPDGIATGMAQALGWEANADPNDPRVFTFPSTPLAQFAKRIAARLDIRAMRVVGDPNLPVRRAMASWGYVMREPGIQMLSRPDVDVLMAGETWEWELVEYAQDIATTGKKKALILLGHVVSEQAGMKYCAEWLKSFIPEVPIEFIPAPEPFWSTACI